MLLHSEPGSHYSIKVNQGCLAASLTVPRESWQSTRSHHSIADCFNRLDIGRSASLINQLISGEGNPQYSTRIWRIPHTTSPTFAVFHGKWFLDKEAHSLGQVGQFTLSSMLLSLPLLHPNYKLQSPINNIKNTMVFHQHVDCSKAVVETSIIGAGRKRKLFGIKWSDTDGGSRNEFPI